MTESGVLRTSCEIREASVRLSVLIKQVRAGGEVLLTDRGRPVAKIVQLSPEDQSPEERIADLEARQWLEPVLHRGRRYLPPPLPLDSPAAQQFLQEDRSNCVSVRAIHDEAGHRQALQEIALLWNDEREEAQARLEVQCILVDTYERETLPLPPPHPVEALRFFLEERGLNPKDLEPFLGSRQRVSDVLRGKRRLSLAMIQRLRDGLGIPADCLIGPTPAQANPPRET